MTREPLVQFRCVTPENWLGFRVDFKSAFRNTNNGNFPIAENFIFWPYANLFKLGSGTIIITFYYAEPSKDQMCQVSFL